MIRFSRRSLRRIRSSGPVGLLASALTAAMLLNAAPASAVPASAATASASTSTSVSTSAAPNPEPSDSRAQFVPENITTCAQAGYPDDVQISGQNNDDAGDTYVKGTGTGSSPTMVQVEITPAGTSAGVVVDAVVIKGGDASNVYKAPNVPPQLQAPQNYISPKNTGGNVADVSHYLICYHFAAMPRGVQGELLVLKRVAMPVGTPAEPLPTEYTVDVVCTAPSGDTGEETLTFGSGGGLGTTADGRHILRNIPADSTCTVTEQGTDDFPEGATVTYFPAGAPDPGVNTDRVNTVIVTNDFSGVRTMPSRFKITKNVVPPAHGQVPSSFTVTYSCQDGTAGAAELSPGEIVTVRNVMAGTYCIVREGKGELPAGWKVSYAVDGRSSTDAPVFKVEDTRTVTVTVSNDGTGASDGGAPDKDGTKD
ncbi:DUF5979 domain-containing protein [Streptomyces mesophilus]|uniref:DUF5979 domain-containing protein n=1 Tax=Streptomyces mesophilus TaxID=1775132 RepID=UPI00332515DE